MQVIRLDSKVLDLHIKFFGFLPDKAFKVVCDISNQYRKAVLRSPHEVIVQVANTPGCMSIAHEGSIAQC